MPTRPQTLRTLIKLLTLLLVVAVALLLRLRAVELLPVDYDEDDYLRAAQQMATAVQDGHWARLTELNYRPEHPPLAKLAYALALVPLDPAAEIPDRPTTAAPAASLPQPHLRAARLTAAGFGVLEALALALVSPLAGLFLAIHTFTIKYTSQVMLEALPALTSLLSILAYSRAWRRPGGATPEPGSAAQRPAIGWLALSAMLLGITVASKYLYGVVGLAILFHWIMHTGRGPARQPSFAALGRWLGPLLLWGLLVGSMFLAANPYLWPAPLSRLAESILFHGSYASGEAVRRAGFPLWQPLVWAFSSVPWHPGVFVVALDLLIGLLALGGLKRLWQRHQIFALWLGIGLAFLLVWPTKWPQYVLLLSAPLCLAAAEGFQALIWEPGRARLQRSRPADAQVQPGRGDRAGSAAGQWRQVLPWLLPGALVLTLIALFPMIYQAAMALTDFNAISIRDGISGGVWREVWLGLTGQVEPVVVELFSPGRPSSREVHYAGPGLFLQLLGNLDATSLLVFEVLWTGLSVSLQAALGLAAALLLIRPGVRFANGWRALFILPWAIPEFVAALIWLRLFQPDTGWLSLAAAHLPAGALQLPNTWRNSPDLALIVMLVAGTWYGFPFMMLAATAALKLIPGEVYEAAALDGASGWQLFQRITWPLLLPLLVPALLVRGIFAFNQFYLFVVMNPPFPLSTLAVTSFFLFNTNFGGGLFAVSAAINLLAVVFLVLFVFWFDRRTLATEGVTYA
jgi:ABC-type sugar transport system permease subunit